jgi:hypothetical protein
MISCPYCKTNYQTSLTLETHLKSSHFDISNEDKKTFLNDVRTRLNIHQEDISHFFREKKKKKTKNTKKRVRLVYTHFESDRSKH